jgi:hypothetical protein
MRVGVKDPIRRSIVLSELSPPAAHAEVFNSACRLAANMKSSVAANRPVEAYVELEGATSAVVHIAPKEERHLTVMLTCSEDNPYTLSAELVTTEGITKTKNTFNISTPSEYQALLQEMRRFLS